MFIPTTETLAYRGYAELYSGFIQPWCTRAHSSTLTIISY